MIERKLILTLVQIGVLILIDWQVFRVLRQVVKKLRPAVRRSVWALLILTSIAGISIAIWYHLANNYKLFNLAFYQWVISAVLVIYISKLVVIPFALANDIQLYTRKLISRFKRISTDDSGKSGKPITRSEFLSKAALAATAIPFSGAVFGIVHGTYDYRIRKRTIYLPDLPNAFDGIRIGQISDIHSNGNYNKIAVRGGIEMLLNEKTDVIFFTGDLVNFRTSEVDAFINIFEKVKAPLGVYSVTGNHDYGDYMIWPGETAKRKNFLDLVAVHKQMGYDLLLNENRLLKVNGEEIAILGVENWGTGRFPKYGKLDLAYKGTEEIPVKLLLSHDPSHWDAQVRPHYPDIDVMFAGHTHGFQFGIEVGGFKWSPAQYTYKQWADLYTEGSQSIYVNRGFGCIGYLGRIGMPPELTVIELKRGSRPTLS